MTRLRPWMRKWWGAVTRSSERSLAKSSKEVVDEAEALLDGHWLDRASLDRFALPARVWLNALAHRDPGTLATLPAGPVDDAGWRHLAMSLAALDGGLVRDIQQAVLIPAELDALTGAAGRPEPPLLRIAICHYLASRRSPDSDRHRTS